MIFALICTDKPASLELRTTTRPAHIEYLKAHAAQIVHGGALLDAEGKPGGSLLLVDMPDRAAVERFAANDPYAQAGLFESTVIRPLRTAVRDGAMV